MRAHLTLVSCLLLSTASADDWPQYNGATSTRTSTAALQSASFPEGGPRVVWEVATQTGFASFTVAGGRAFTLVRRDPIGIARTNLIHSTVSVSFDDQRCDVALGDTDHEWPVGVGTGATGLRAQQIEALLDQARRIVVATGDVSNADTNQQNGGSERGRVARSSHDSLHRTSARSGRLNI